MTPGSRRIIGLLCLAAGLALGGTSLAGLTLVRGGAGGDPAVTFTLVTPASKPDAAGGRRAALIIELTGQPAGRHELAAIIDGPLLTRFMAPLDPGGSPRSWRADVVLDLPAPDKAQKGGAPAAGDAASGRMRQDFQRMNVTFTRLQGMSVVPFLHRPVYLNVTPIPDRAAEDPPPAAAAKAEAPPVTAAPSPPAAPPSPLGPSDTAPAAPKPGPSLPGIEREPVAPLHEEPITETALPLPPAPLPPLPPQPAAVVQPVSAATEYWHQAEQRVTAKFKQYAKGKSAGSRPRVRFRLYHDGIARTIFLERSSGNPAVDQAGLDSVMDAHPFPPFPDDVPEPYVDVHVDFRSKGR